MSKDAVLFIRVTKELRERIENEAKEAGVTTSELIRLRLEAMPWLAPLTKKIGNKYFQEVQAPIPEDLELRKKIFVAEMLKGREKVLKGRTKKGKKAKVE